MKLYLSPKSNYQLLTETKQLSDKSFIQVNYQSLVDSLVQPSMDATVSDRAKIFINDYIRTLSFPTCDKPSIKSSAPIIPKAEKELLLDFKNTFPDMLSLLSHAFTKASEIYPSKKKANDIVVEEKLSMQDKLLLDFLTTIQK